MTAIKHDANKPDMSLLSPKWLFGVSYVLTFGAKKYSAHNWRKGFKITRCLAAALRHIFLFLDGHTHSGANHLDNASCMIMFARELWETHPELDDRYSELS